MRNVFLFIRRHFNFLFFLVLQIIALSFLFRFNKFHQAAFLNVSTEITGRINERYNNIEYYFQLKKTNESLVQENARLRQQLKENYEAPDSLTRLIHDTIRVDSTSIIKYKIMEAKVVGNTTSLQDNYLTIHRGFDQGVRPNMGVTGPQGIVGSVVNVSKNFATVQSMLHYQFKYVAKLKHSNETGTIGWDGLSPLYVIMKGIPKSAKVEKGDTVLTTQLTSTFPANLMIGTVAEIVPDNSSSFYTLKVRAATNFGNIEYVYVIDNLQYEEQKMLEDSTRKKIQ
ncbi:rod shape-determining protein MreC [Puia dinghuensis]|uniref:Cell shape-determining protein MreC n=1 Tax=Puia dinghuensis TaxID=1792502 RepID=A0A8J2UEQ8_9BACT|nr:rod shape-determining protein MreC [Puia dinghuensis]GGB07693.1 rod shape-determining protein MreC [Puia dinghuensis]